MTNEAAFFLFGMGNRKKYFYKSGKLYEYPSLRIVRSWDVVSDEISADRYTVTIRTADNRDAVLFENEQGLYIREGDELITLCESRLLLPDFAEYRHAPAMRILHHEILVNILDGQPLPNYFVYRKPWYRDGAMMAMVLRKTGNISLLREWIMGLYDPFDRNNAGNEEPDNLGQALYLISCVSDASHPLVNLVLEESEKRTDDGILQGITDGENHPVYAAKWLKYGLESLGLPSDSIIIPRVADSYSSLFWMDYRSHHVETPRRAYDRDYPYLWWAEQHFYNEVVDEKYVELHYPMTHETRASEAHYEAIRPLSEPYADGKTASPHTWHAAEMLLYMMEGK